MGSLGRECAVISLHAVAGELSLRDQRALQLRR